MKPSVRSRFLKVRCPGCGQEQVLFDRASGLVTCLQCEATLAEPSGGKARIAPRVTILAEL
ncbi:MAG: 30S ribosomal protein S27e [Halobacteria archaeon]